uniref:tRNA(Met) cytidine acetyltransferase n=1 Tax=Fervidicoccus fontis TaxID=683846 RepID=A0A7J3ZK82_9CREN
MLKQEYFKVGEPDRVVHKVIPPKSLAKSPQLLRKVYNLLALAHYRTEPDYLLTILESREHSIHALTCGDEIVAVADVAWEDWSNPPGGYLGLKVLSAHTSRALKLRGARVVRIAVHPELQKRGLERKLVQNIETWAIERGADVVTVVFGRHDVMQFWMKLGYTPFYLSPRFNRYTGEKNVGVARALSPSGSVL